MAEGIPQRTGKWRASWLDTSIEIGYVDPEVKKAYMQAFGLEEYTTEDSKRLVQYMESHLALARKMMERHGIEDLTKENN